MNIQDMPGVLRLTKAQSKMFSPDASVGLGVSADRFAAGVSLSIIKTWPDGRASVEPIFFSSDGARMLAEMIIHASRTADGACPELFSPPRCWKFPPNAPEQPA